MTKRTGEFVCALLNFVCGIVGVFMVWRLTHSWAVLGWVFVASLHFTATTRREEEDE